MDEFAFDTLAVRAGTQRSNFNENSEGLFLTSSFVHESAEMAAKRFANQAPGNVYSRFTNPTVTMFQDRLAALEGAQACVATASGMAAVSSCVMGLLKSGDHVVCSRSVFGSVITLFEKYLSKFGILCTFVEASDVSAWSAAITPATKMLFVETPSNPLSELADIAALKAIAVKAGAWLVVDNCFCTPAVQRPLDFGADIVIHSATKFIDGQGRVIGGAVVGRKAEMEEVHGFLRTSGPSMSPFNAWVLLKGMETLSVRMEAQTQRAWELARWLETQSAVERVYYAGLDSHPQLALAQVQQSASGKFLPGAVVSFVARGGKPGAWRIVDGCKVISITANLGDTKSTITHPASTTHGRISQAARDSAGIVDGLLRVSVGLENVEDLKRDLARGMGA